jgi:MFS family permease
MSTDPAPTGPREDLPGVERLLTLSDGVVAIAITLLVLQLNVPPPGQQADSASVLATQLGKDADQLISYVISFYVIVLSIGIAWVNTGAVKYCWLLLAVAPPVADRWSRRHAPDRP